MVSLPVENERERESERGEEKEREREREQARERESKRERKRERKRETYILLPSDALSLQRLNLHSAHCVVVDHFSKSSESNKEEVETERGSYVRLKDFRVTEL